VPELEKLPTEHLFAPWEAPENVLRAAGIELGRTYPKPLVDHGAARARALAAFQSLRAAA
jgi:deoxyribodipyrimidine photo-lyase